jgi:prevent-host-death family protein
MRTITASDANRNFSSLLREVSSGESVLIVSRGRPVATISPVEAETNRPAAQKALLSRLDTQPVTGTRDWTRDELYGE